jgi:hypothetical protein
MTNNPVHVTAVDSDHRRSAGLTFQRDKAKRLLNARMTNKSAAR